MKEHLLGLEESGAHQRCSVPPPQSRQKREPTLCFNVGIAENTTDVRTLLSLLLRFIEAAIPQELRVRYLTYFCHFSTLQRRKLRLRTAKVTALEILERPGHYFPHCSVRLLRFGPSFPFKTALCERGRKELGAGR